MSAGQLIGPYGSWRQWQAVSIGQLQHQWWQAVGCFATSRGSPTLVISAVSCCQCTSAKIDVLWHRSSLCHQNQKKRTSPQTGDKNTTEETGEGQAIQHVARIVRYDRPVMGLWISYVGPLFFSNEIPANVGQNKPFPKTSLAQMTCLTIVCVCFLTSHVTSAQKSNFQLSVRFRFQQVHFPNKVGVIFPYWVQLQAVFNSSQLSSQTWATLESCQPSTHQSLSFHHQDSSGSHSSAVSLSLPFFSLVDFPFPLDLGDLVA